MKSFISVLLTWLAASPVFANTYKCFSKDVDSQEIPYEIQISFAPIRFEFTAFYRNEDGSLESFSEVLADSVGVKKPISLRWIDCKTNCRGAFCHSKSLK
jgi:hypothetical protein